MRTRQRHVDIALVPGTNLRLCHMSEGQPEETKCCSDTSCFLLGMHVMGKTVPETHWVFPGFSLGDFSGVL